MRLRATVPCSITPTVGYDRYGKEQLGKSYTAKCAIVKLTQVSEPTSVRTDSSASRGAAREIIADARLLFPRTVDVNIDDKVEVMGMSLKVLSVFPRTTIGGQHDHNQVDLMVWA